MNTVQMLQAVASGERSARELCEAALNRVADTNGVLNAFTEVTTARALEEAEAIDARRRRGEPLPPLAGLPYAVKNLYDLQGVTTLAGSRMYTSMADTDEIVDEALEGFETVLSSVEGL